MFNQQLIGDGENITTSKAHCTATAMLFLLIGLVKYKTLRNRFIQQNTVQYIMQNMLEQNK